MHAPITDAQRRKLFALARERGLDLDDLRAMTPAGSISLLRIDQAAELIDRIEGRPNPAPPPRTAHRRPRLPAGVIRLATAEQRAEIDRLAEAISAHYGWTRADLEAWLQPRRHRLTPDTSREAMETIRFLRQVLMQARCARWRTRQRSAAHASP